MATHFHIPNAPSSLRLSLHYQFISATFNKFFRATKRSKEIYLHCLIIQHTEPIDISLFLQFSSLLTCMLHFNAVQSRKEKQIVRIFHRWINITKDFVRAERKSNKNVDILLWHKSKCLKCSHGREIDFLCSRLPSLAYSNSRILEEQTRHTLIAQ